MAENQTSVLYLEKQLLYFYDGFKISKLDFTSDTVLDFDSLNDEAFVNLIFQFIEVNKPKVSHYIFVLSESTLFVGETMQKDPLKMDAEFKNFTDLVPYNNVVSKNYSVGDSTKIVASNQDLINLIRDAFAQKGYICADVVPAFVFGEIGVRKGFDIEMANYIVKNQRIAFGKSMTAPVMAAPVNVFKVTKGKSTMLPMLLGIFGVMTLVLVLLLFLRR